MNLADLWAQIEADFAWRQDEIRFLRNQASAISDVSVQDRFRRAAILLLYAHFEGFCHFAFTLYVNAINAEGILCGQANFAIAAASLSDVFHELRDPLRKCNEFRNTMPDDSKLHLFARDREFVERSVDFEKRAVRIPESVVDTESNLKPEVLRKNLYRLGFRHDQFAPIEGHIHMLLNRRNAIAHGASQNGIAASEFDRIRRAVFVVMDQIKQETMKALQDQRYMRM